MYQCHIKKKKKKDYNLKYNFFKIINIMNLHCLKKFVWKTFRYTI